MPHKDLILSEIRDDIGTVLSPENLSTMALPWLSFARTMVRIAKEDTKNYTYVNPVNKLIINNYLGASMVLAADQFGQEDLSRSWNQPGGRQEDLRVCDRKLGEIGLGRREASWRPRKSC